MIYIHKGDDTDFNDNSFLTFNIVTEKDLTNWQAKFILNGLEKTFDDITSKSFQLHFSDEETSQFKLGKTTNELRLIDEEGKIKTVAKNIDIYVTNDVIENESQLINLPILKDEGIDINISLASNSGSGSAISNHFELLYRDMENQHPIKAITNLQKTLDDKANKDELPTKTSELTNDSSFATESFVTNKIAEAELGGSEVDLSGLATKDELNAKQDIIDDLEEIRTNATNSIKDVSNLATKDELTNKQDTLISGTNIKTINNQSILGSGNITIEGGSGSNGDANINDKITNCLLEVPQRIKLELVEGKLTIKVGSVATIPEGLNTDGTSKFNHVTVEEDLTWNFSTLTGTFMIFYGVNNTPQLRPFGSNCASGTSDPNTKGTTYYNTATNILVSHNTSADLNVSLPLGFVTVSSGVVTSIDQVFNSIGFIGSTLWVDKDVKYLVPNGRNEDGTLKNIECTTQNVLTFTANTTSNHPIYLDSNFALFYTAQVSYNRDKNLNVIKNTCEDRFCCEIGKVTAENGYLSNLKPKTAFNALDYNDRSEISGWSATSDKAISLTLGANGTKYTAPANGWVFVRKNATATSQYLVLVKYLAGDISYEADVMWSTSNTMSLYVNAFVSKGEQFGVNYTAGGDASANYFRFVYAKGEV